MDVIVSYLRFGKVREKKFAKRLDTRAQRDHRYEEVTSEAMGGQLCGHLPAKTSKEMSLRGLHKALTHSLVFIQF